jgi:hypothetical protein
LWLAAVAWVWQVWKAERARLLGEVDWAEEGGKVAAFMHQGRCRKVDMIMATAKSATASAAARPELQ